MSESDLCSLTVIKVGDAPSEPIARRKTRPIFLGKLQVGCGAPISVQSMAKTDTRDLEAVLAEIKSLQSVGCEVVRLAVKDDDSAKALSAIKSAAKVPLVADIHFDYRLAIDAIERGVDGIRLNPGNIGSERRVAAVVQAAKGKAVPIRIGVNAGSLEKDLLEKYGGPCAEAMVDSAMRHVAILERHGFDLIKISLKSADVRQTIKAYREISNKVDYPLHLGITEAGTKFSGGIKSAVGIGALLLEGIGDTIRVSLTADPVEEVRAGFEILKALGLRRRGPEIISCPTCGRIEVDLIPLVEELERKLAGMEKPLKVAVMGCCVNGPGEASQADIGIAAGKGSGLIFKRGAIIGKVREEDFLKTLLQQIEDFDKDK